MPKNASGSWVGTSVQPQLQTYQTAGMLQPVTPSQPPAPPPPPPPPTGGTGGTGGSGGSGGTVGGVDQGAGSGLFGLPIVQPQQPVTPIMSPITQPQNNQQIQRDRLAEAILQTQFMEQ